MKKCFGLITAITLCVTLTSQAQPGGRGGMGRGPAPDFSGAMAKYFGENPNFSANLEIEGKDPQGAAITMPGKMAFSEGKARFEMNMADMKGGNIPPQAKEQMKAMGMDQIVAITQPDKKVTDLIYPSMKAYVEMPLQEKGGGSPDDYKMEMTELGKETVDGHPCIKNKAVVTDKEGNKHEATLWNATDLKKFPIKIESNEQGQQATMSFKNVQFSKPAASQFEIPEGLKKYDSPQAMMMDVMSKRYGGGQGFQRPQPPTPGQ